MNLVKTTCHLAYIFGNTTHVSHTSSRVFPLIAPSPPHAAQIIHYIQTAKTAEVRLCLEKGTSADQVDEGVRAFIQELFMTAMLNFPVFMQLMFQFL